MRGMDGGSLTTGHECPSMPTTLPPAAKILPRSLNPNRRRASRPRCTRCRRLSVSGRPRMTRLWTDGQEWSCRTDGDPESGRPASPPRLLLSASRRDGGKENLQPSANCNLYPRLIATFRFANNRIDCNYDDVPHPLKLCTIDALLVQNPFRGAGLVGMRDWTRCICECIGARARLFETSSHVSTGFDNSSKGNCWPGISKRDRFPRENQIRVGGHGPGMAGAARLGGAGRVSARAGAKRHMPNLHTARPHLPSQSRICPFPLLPFTLFRNAIDLVRRDQLLHRLGKLSRRLSAGSRYQ